MANNDVLKIKDLDPDFRYEVAREFGGEGILKCYACGTCTASCPVREVDEKFNPRKIIHMVLLGMREEVLNSDFVWLCATCYSCQERCPQGVRITDIMCALQNIATREGKIHSLYREGLNLLANFGRFYEIDEFDNKRREKMGLPAVQSVNPEVRKILELTGAIKHIPSQQAPSGGEK